MLSWVVCQGCESAGDARERVAIAAAALKEMALIEEVRYMLAAHSLSWTHTVILGYKDPLQLERICWCIDLCMRSYIDARSHCIAGLSHQSMYGRM